MSTLVEISHKESDDLARKHKEAEIKASIIASLPELPYYQAVYGHGYKSEGSVKLLENNGTQLIETYKVLPPVDLVKHSDSCTSFFPKERLDKKDKGEVIDVSPFTFTLEGFKFEGRTTKEFTFDWFTKLNSLMVKVEVNLEFNRQFSNMPDIFLIRKEIALNEYRMVWEESPGIKNVIDRVKWYQTKDTGRYTYYWKKISDSKVQNLEDIIPSLWLDHGKEENVQI